MRKSISRYLTTIAGGLALLASSAPASWAQSPSNEPTTAFWQQIGDSTLTRLVAEALRNGTSVHIAEARLDEARAARTLSMFDLAPTVTANGSALRTRQSMAQVPGLASPLPQRDLYDVGFDAAWELDLFGRVRHSVGAQDALATSAEHSLEDVQVSLSAEVGRTYFELRGAQQQLAVALRNADVQRKTVALTESRLAAGRGTAFDVERARSVLQLTLAGVPTLEAQISASWYRLASLLGRGDQTIPAELLAGGASPDLPDSVNVGSADQLVRHRPDVLAAERQAAAQSMSVGAAKADYMPRVALAASTGYTADRIESLTRTGTSRVMVGPVVSFPLFDLGRVRQRVGFAEARRDEANAQYAATVLQAVEETERTKVAYARAHERLALLEEAVKSSANASALAQERFEAGLTDFLQVLDAQRTQLEAESQLASAQTAASTALVALYKATGGTLTIR